MYGVLALGLFREMWPCYWYFVGWLLGIATVRSLFLGSGVLLPTGIFFVSSQFPGKWMDLRGRRTLILEGI